MRLRSYRSRVVIAGIIAVGCAAAPASRAVASMLRVSADGTSCSRARFNSIQDAVDAARPNDTVVVCAGVYDEQVVVRKKLKIRGKRGATVRPSGMIANTTSLRTGEPLAGVIVATARTKIKGLEIDAAQNGLDCDGPILIGVFFRGVSGGLKKSEVHGTRLAGAGSVCETGAGVLVQGDGTRTIKVAVAGNEIFDYQRAGVVVNEFGARATITGNTITGLGPTPDLPQNGIQVAFGGFAKVVKNMVRDNATPTTGSCAFDAGNLIFAANRGTIFGNTFAGNSGGVYVAGSSNRVIKNRLDGMSDGVPAGLDGITIVGDTNLVLRNTVRDMSAAGIRVLGDANKIARNTVAGTRSANLCDMVRTTSGCEDLLSQCGVGVWIASGIDNVLKKNSLSGNDTDLIDEGLSSRLRR